MKRIVLTGGPGAGKTVIAARIAGEQPDRYALVPEAATQVYTQLQTRWDRLDLDGRHDVQRRIYRLQLAQEQRLAAAHPDKHLLLDRGTLDGAAYWPQGARDYWRDLQTDHSTELLRYDAVILLETAATLGIYDGEQSNFCRFEDPQAAIAAGEVLKELWAAHPRLHVLPAYERLDEKIAAVRTLLSQLL